MTTLFIGFIPILVTIVNVVLNKYLFFIETPTVNKVPEANLTHSTEYKIETDELCG